MTVAQHLHLRLFLEGVEIPVISASIQSQKNSPAACSIQIPANDYAMDLKPRTLVHLFCRDLYKGAPPEEQVSVSGPGVRIEQRERGVDPELAGLFPPERFESTEDQDYTDLENARYGLCFGGEVMGIQFSKQPGGRSIVLQCLDWSSYWDIAFQYQISGFSLGGGGIRAAFTGASTSVFNDFLEGSADQLVNKIMTKPPRSYPKLRGTLLGALVHIVEAIGGVYFGTRAVRGTNDFFSLAEMRLHLTQMVGANPFPQNDEVRLLRARGFGSLFRRSLSGLGKLVTIRQVLMALQKYIFHEHIPITSPRYIPPLTDPNLPKFETVGLSEDPETRPLARFARRLKSRAEEMKQRQSLSVDTRSARRQSDRHGGLQREVRRLVNVTKRAARLARLVGLQGGNSTRLADFFGIPEVHAAFSVAGSRFVRILDATRRGQRPDVRTYTFYPPGGPSASTVNTALDDIIADMQRVLESTHRRRVQRRSSQPDPPPRLLTNIYRPDVWMVAPPRCNVIFPELYSSFTYGRNFNQEVTRLLLRTHSAFLGSDILFDGFFMSPSRIQGQRFDRPVGRGRIGHDPDLSDAPAHVVRDLMNHELYTGILPTFERMSDLNLHALRGKFAHVEGGGRVPYAQLAANHIFFQYRFKSRQLVCSGKLNPYIAFGFPCVIIDKYLPTPSLEDSEYDVAIAARLAEAVAEGEGDLDIGGPPAPERQQIREANVARVTEVLRGVLEQRPNTHYLGTPESLSHSISAQSGGNTSMTMTYARTTNEKTEFLGDNVFTHRARRQRNRRIPHVVAAREAPVVGGRGPRGGNIVEVTEVTDRYQRRQRRLRTTDRTATGQERYRGGDRIPLYHPTRQFITSGRRRGTRVLVGVTQPAASYGPEVVALVGTGGVTQSAIAEDNTIMVTFKAFRIVEEVGIYAREQIDIPPEEMVFPPWYGEHYKSNNIGGLYSYFFGTGAITDPLSVIAEGSNAQRVAQQFDGGTIGGEEAPAAERSVQVAFAERFNGGVASTDAPVSMGDDAPSPGYASTSAEPIGPPGEPDAEDPNGIAFLANVEGQSPIAVALEEVVRAYSLVKINRFDVHQFIRSYTWRPIATMVDLFGTANLEINDQGEVVRGREGFHSRAFGDFDDLRQLVGPGEGDRPRTILGLHTAAPDEVGKSSEREAQVAARLDTRKEKRLQVLRYINALAASRGIVG